MTVNEIRIKRDGKWYADHAEMFRKPFLNLFATHLERDENNGYYIHLGEETFPVMVEDVPFLVTSAATREGNVILLLHDHQHMELDEETPIRLIEEVPYITFRWDWDTRLNRSAFWMISEFLVEKDDGLYIVPPSVDKK